jgi:hypothetical protein
MEWIDAIVQVTMVVHVDLALTRLHQAVYAQAKHAFHVVIAVFAVVCHPP